MNTKFILIILILIILISLGIWWQSKEQNQDSDSIVNLLSEINDNSEIKEQEFNWFIAQDDQVESISLKGKGFELEGVSSQKKADLESFFKNEGFLIDQYNVAAGTLGSLTGYRKDNFACVLIETKQVDQDGLPINQDKNDLEVKCAQSDLSLDPIFTRDYAIKKLFADKYSKKISEIVIIISEESENYVRGGVQFQPSSEGGNFLAAKVDNQWELVFDGNGGISCQLLESYGFPEEMKYDCY